MMQNPNDFLVFEELSNELRAELPIDYKPIINDIDSTMLCSVC